MSRGTIRARMSEREEAHSQINLRKKRSRPTSQFVQIKDECNLRKRRKIKGEHKLVDQISELPDEILINMLSLLPLKQAASTSILSRRWRYLWASTMTLSFDAFNFDVGNTFTQFTELKRELRDKQSFRYVDWVNRVVEQHRGQNIERFRACFFLDYRFKSSIDKWIQFAMERRVQILDLEFLDEKSFGDEDYTFPQKLLGISTEKGSALEQFLYSAWENLQYFPNLHSCGASIGFKSLKVLRLRHVGVTGEFIEYLLSNSPVLETLSLNAARGLVNLRVVGPSNAFKHLVIKQCHDLESIEICDTKIVSLIYPAYDVTNLLLKNVPSLVAVSISKKRCRIDSIRLPFTQLLCCLSQLEFLKLDIRGADNNENGVFPKLENLKHLELVVAPNHQALHHLTYFLKVSPYLQRLVLKLEGRMGAQAGIVAHRETGEMEKAAKHRYLKVVEMAGYRACTCAVELVMHIIENVDAMEKIVIDPVRTWCWPSGMDRPIEEVEEEVEGRNHAVEHLKEKVPSTIEFLCL